MKIVNRKISELIPAEYNPRQLSKDQFEDIRASINRFGIVDPIIVNKHPERLNIIIGGHQRCKVAESMGMDKVPTVELNLDLDKEKELNVRLNKNTGAFDMDALANYFDEKDLIDWGFTQGELVGFTDDDVAVGEQPEGLELAEAFGVPPFTILDTRQGYWQDRKREWKNLILDKGETRETSMNELDELKYGTWKGNLKAAPEVSILDPVLSEIICKWFTPGKSKVFDCFAGDSVFGYVSSSLGHDFTGIELRPDQANINNERVASMTAKYICDDGRSVLQHIGEDSMDLLFSCPPYYDLEVYSDMDNDASNQETYEDFMSILDTAFTDSIQCLKDDRFAVIVVGDVRDKEGYYYRFVDHIKDIFERAGMRLYNEMILVEMIGTLAMRAARTMRNRKVSKCHQNVLVFYKGDIKKIKKNYKDLTTEITDESRDI